MQKNDDFERLAFRDEMSIPLFKYRERGKGKRGGMNAEKIANMDP